MKPLVNSLTEFDELMEMIRPGHIIGFLMDSGIGELRRSGLIAHPECVLPMDQLMGNRATIFYVGPNLKGERDAYRDAVEAFNHSISQRPEITFDINPPCLILMQHQAEVLGQITYHPFPRRAMAIWFNVLHSALKEKLQQAEQSKDRWVALQSAVINSMPSLAMESLKVSVGLLLSRVI